jgi:CubicO group peptidase (beta-lactamase class C family)
MRYFLIAILIATVSTVSFQQEAQSQQRQQKLSGGPQDSYQLWKADPLRVVKMDPAAKARGIQKDFSSEAFSELRKSAQAAVDLPGTTALALVDKGVLVFEGYALGKGASPQGRFVSMSVAKSVTALAVGEALCAGKIKDLADKAEGYAPSLRGTPYGESSVRDLLMMASGAKSGTIESHGNSHPTATRENLLGSRTIAEHIEQFKDRDRTAGDAVLSGTRFAYNNLDTAALAFVVQGATGMPFHQWTQQTIVEKSGFADSSFWHVDRAGQPLNYAYFNASLEDWIRLALRFREIIKGETDESCLKAFMESGTKTLLPTFRASWSGYGYQIWTDHPRFRSTFWMLGFGGQRIAIDPVTDKILINFSWSPEAQVLTLFHDWNRNW